VTTQPSVLLVEDDPNDARLALRALSGLVAADGVRVARDGVEALEVLRTTTPRLLLLDIKLPRLDGLQVLKVLKADERTRAIPVVVLTSSREPGDIENAYRLGANSYIVKPADYKSFTAALSAAGAYWLEINLTPLG
jgi:two-component system response regulator